MTIPLDITREPSPEELAERDLLVEETLRVTREEAAARLAALQLEMKRRSYITRPDLWAAERLRDHLWSKQVEVVRAVEKYRRVAVASCHEIGKSYIAAEITGWWLDIWPTGEAFVVTSAPSAPQVRTILWREIGRVHARGELRGRVNQVEWLMRTPDGNEEQVAVGRKPDDYNPTAFQGIHARRVLILFDEACGMPAPLWEAGDSLIANDDGKFLAIGNPDDPSSHFAEICKPGSGWHVINISAFDSPNFTGEPCPEWIAKQLIGKVYVEEKRKKWAPNWKWNAEGTRVEPPANDPSGAKANPLWTSKVLGQFPDLPEAGGLIPIHWIKAAQVREIVVADSTSSELGVDVGAGGDSSTIAHRKGGRVRIIHEDRNPDTMVTCGTVIAKLRETRSEKAKVDSIGIGKGVCDRAQELKQPVFPVNVGEAADDTEAYLNLRAQRYWELRERFERGEIDIDPEDDDLAGELVEIRYKRTSKGQIQIESKDEMKRRGVPSPNRAEAVMLAFAPERGVRGPFAQYEASWGG